MALYGFGVSGLETTTTGPAPPDDWPAFVVERAPSKGPDRRADPGIALIGPDHGWMQLADREFVEVTREPLRARFVTARPVTDEELMHPYLATPIAIAAGWRGRHSVHGACFALDGRAWALCGDMESGKSSMLAWAHGHGAPAIADDLLVCDGRQVFAGPRNIDLRETSAAVYGGRAMGVVGRRERWRLTPPRAPLESALGGFVHLEWGDDLSLTPLKPQERFEALVRHSVLPPEAGTRRTFLELISLPAWRLTRPRDLAGIDRVGDQLTAVLTQA